MAADLCPELMLEIFTRLPPKSLLRFRSVSTSIRALISSPDFVRLHALRSHNKFTIIHRVSSKAGAAAKSVYTINPAEAAEAAAEEEEGRLSYTGTTPVEYPFKDFNIVGSCNGILCVYEFGRNSVHLWNPSIRRKATVSPPPPPRVPGLAVGFGFDSTADDYKILWTATGGQGSFVYSFNTCTWRGIASPAVTDGPDSLSVINSRLCYFNGALHWAVKTPATGSCYMTTFDLASEVFSTIDLPQPTNTVTVIKGCLAVISSKDASIWVRTASASTGWYLAFKFDAPRQPVRSIHGDLLFSRKAGILDYHHPDTGLPSRLVNLTASSSYVAAMFTCIESLELLDHGTSCEQIRTGPPLLDMPVQTESGFTFLDSGTSSVHTLCGESGGLPLPDTGTAGNRTKREAEQ